VGVLDMLEIGDAAPEPDLKGSGIVFNGSAAGAAGGV